MSRASTSSEQDATIINAWKTDILLDPIKHVRGRVSQETTVGLIPAAAALAMSEVQKMSEYEHRHASLIITLTEVINHYKNELSLTKNKLVANVVIILLEDLKIRLQAFKTVIPNPGSVSDEEAAQKVRDVVYAWKIKHVEGPLAPFIFEIDIKLTPLNDIETMRSVLNDMMVELSSEQLQFIDELRIIEAMRISEKKPSERYNSREKACTEEIENITKKLDALAQLDAEAKTADPGLFDRMTQSVASKWSTVSMPKFSMPKFSMPNFSTPSKTTADEIELMGGSKRRKSKKSKNKRKSKKSRKSRKSRKTIKSRNSMKIRRIRRTRKSRI